MSPAIFRTPVLIPGVAMLVLCGCAKEPSSQSAAQTFTAPEDAVTAFVAALEHDRADDLSRMLGDEADRLISSGDAIADRAARKAFLARYYDQYRLVAGGPNDLVLQVGADRWPLPIPLVLEQGRWRFDGAAGAHEILARRIGANELRTIDVMHGYVQAQHEYAVSDHDGVPAGVYAQRLRSEPGKHDGLYWEIAPGETPSPAGPFLAAAAAEGYEKISGAPYHGYLYRILQAQGAAAEGGALDYLVEGKLQKGFGLLAYPATYGASGVMTFMVNHDGVVWQRDLGDKTLELVAAITTYDPDSNWTPLAPESLAQTN